MLPNFIIVGTPKAGSTSLYHYLSEHPEVFMSEPKEVNFFSKEEIEAQGLYYADFKAKDMESYEQLFDNVKNEKAVGEGSVSYLYYPDTPKKIKAVLPDVKIIILLREPVARAFSHYLMDYRMGLVDLSFEDIVYQQSNHAQSHLFYQQFIELGLYYEQVKRYIDLFGQGQVKIYLQDDLRYKSTEVIKGLYAYLGVDSTFSPNLQREHNAFSMPKSRLIHKLYAFPLLRSIALFLFRDKFKETVKNIFFERKRKPTLSEDTKTHLYDLYAEDIQKLESLIQRDLTAWRKP